MRRGLCGLVAALLIASCSQTPEYPSEESEFLQSAVVPALIRWGAGPSESLDLSRILSRRGYDSVCLVPEYTSLIAVEEEVGDLGIYHGRRGATVPETHTALVAVKGHVAHVAYIYQGDLFLYGRDRRCFDVRAAGLYRVTTTGGMRPRAETKEK